MRVIIYDADDNRELKILLPTDLIMNPLTAAVAAKLAGRKLGLKAPNRINEAAERLAESAKNGSEEEITSAAKDIVVESLSETAVSLNIEPRIFSEAFRELKKFRKKHPDLPLVDIYSSDGDRVLVML